MSITSRNNAPQIDINQSTDDFDRIKQKNDFETFAKKYEKK